MYASTRVSYMVLVGKPERTRQRGRPKCRQECNIKNGS